MENSQQQILSEIRSLLSSIKMQMEELENKIVGYQQLVDAQEVDDMVLSEPVVDMSAESVETETVAEVVEETVVETVPTVMDEVMDIELEPSDDLPFYDDLPSVEAEEVNECIPEEPVNDPVVEPVIEPVVEQVSVPVIDAMTAKQAWRTDMPGSPVKDIRSAISLHERILFINYLFGEDPMAFQEMLTQLNAMASFDEAAAHAIAVHPEWDLESDTVYRFMMALRRRHQ